MADGLPPHFPANSSTTSGRASRRTASSDSPLEGAGFEPSVPLEVLIVGIVPCRLRGPFHASLPKTKFAADSALEEERFEPPVPLGGEVPETSNETPPPKVEEGCSEKHPVLRGDRRFEYLFLHRRVF